MTKRDLERLGPLLHDGERVQRLGLGLVGAGFGRGRGLVVLTQRRILLIRQGWIFTTLEVLDRSKTTGAQWSGGVLPGTLTISASGRTVLIPAMSRSNGQQLAAYLHA